MCWKNDDFGKDLFFFEKTWFRQAHPQLFNKKQQQQWTVQFVLGSEFGAPNDFSQTYNIIQNDRLILIFGKTERYQNLSVEFWVMIIW
jgi:hypothetical protein